MADEKLSPKMASQESPISIMADDERAGGWADDHRAEGSADDHRSEGSADDHRSEGSADDHRAEGSADDQRAEDLAEDKCAGGMAEDKCAGGLAAKKRAKGRRKSRSSKMKAPKEDVNQPGRSHGVKKNAGGRMESPIKIKIDNEAVIDQRVEKFGRYMYNSRWLNDEVVNDYLQLLVERNHRLKLPSVYAFDNFFYTALTTKTLEKVSRWTAAVDIFGYHYLLMPSYVDRHWFLIVIDNSTRCIRYYDSLGRSNKNSLIHVKNFLSYEKSKKKSQTESSDMYSIEVMEDLPQQRNTNDCGFYILKFADYVTKGISLNSETFSGLYLRKLVVFDLVYNKLR